MGADLYLNPPKETPRTLSQRVADMEQENRDYRSRNATLSQQLKTAQRRIEELKQALKVLQGLKP